MKPSISRKWRPTVVIWATLSLLVSVTAALQVTPGSQCASICMDRSNSNTNDASSSSTQVSDIVCDDSDYTSSVKGLKFKDCLECLQTSRKVEGAETDVYWYLYNLRYAANVCLYNFPAAVQNKSQPCDIAHACGGLKAALRTGDLDPNNGKQLEYCAADSNKMNTWAVDSCFTCLWGADENKILSNFIRALDVGCEQKPIPGALLGLNATLFGDLAVGGTDPPVLETDPPPPSRTTMNIGTIVGIAVGAALLLLGGVALFVVYWRKQRRSQMKDDLRCGGGRGGPSPTGGSSIVGLTGAAGPGGGRGPHTYTMDYKKEGGLTSFDPYDGRGSGGIYTHRSGNQGITSNRYGEHVEQQSQQQPGIMYGMLHQYQEGSNAIPAHPAYIPRAAVAAAVAAGRSSTDSRGSRGTATNSAASPPPSQQHHHIRSSPRATPDPIVITPPPASKQRYAKVSGAESYAMQQYLSSTTDATLRGPPAGPPPSSSSNNNNNNNNLITDPSNLPPPPPRQPKVPALIVPSVTNLRMPKRYSPPQINIEEATPTSGFSENISVPLGLSQPQPRSSSDSHSYTGSHHSGDRIITQTVETFRRQNVPIASGRSRLYE